MRGRGRASKTTMAQPFSSTTYRPQHRAHETAATGQPSLAHAAFNESRTRKASALVNPRATIASFRASATIWRFEQVRWDNVVT